MQCPDVVDIYDAQKERTVRATVVELSPSEARKHIDLAWRTIANAELDRFRREPDWEWAWAKIASDTHEADFAVTVGVRLTDRSIQGAMAYRWNGESFTEPETIALEVELLATAPLNRSHITTQPRFRGVGTALLLHAICHSYFLGLRGRTVLRAIDQPEVLDFYRHRGFESIRTGPADTILMELAPAAAQKLLRDEGMLS